MTPADRQTYAAEVIRAVYGRDPEDLMLSNAEVTEVHKWARQEIPLRVVLQAIGELKTHPTIRYCAPAVLTEWSRVRDARIG